MAKYLYYLNCYHIYSNDVLQYEVIAESDTHYYIEESFYKEVGIEKYRVGKEESGYFLSREEALECKLNRLKRVSQWYKKELSQIGDSIEELTSRLNLREKPDALS